MADYTGRDQRLKYLFQNGGGGGGECKVISGYYHNGDFYEDQSYTQIITGDTECLYIDLDTTTLYLFDGTDYVEVQGGGGGTVSDGTVGVRIDKTFATNESKTYTYDELGITAKGYYILGIATNHSETNGGWKWYGYLCYSGNTTSGYSYVKPIDYNNIQVTMDSVNKTITITNTNSNLAETFRIEVLPLHPKIEIPKHTYSTTEQVVGTWIDGKPIYEQVVDLGITFPAQTSSARDTGIIDIPIANIDYIIAMDINAVSTTGFANIQTFERTSAFKMTVSDITFNATRLRISNINIGANVTWTGVSTIYLIIRYTKSTP